MQNSIPWTHWSSKINCPIQCWDRALAEKIHIFGVIAPFQAWEA
jgi:hypothetical protein